MKKKQAGRKDESREGKMREGRKGEKPRRKGGKEGISFAFIFGSSLIIICFSFSLLKILSSSIAYIIFSSAENVHPQFLKFKRERSPSFLFFSVQLKTHKRDVSMPLV